MGSVFAPARRRRRSLPSSKLSCADHAAADVQEKFRAVATGTVGSSAAEVQVVDAETKMWADVAKAANLKFEQ